MAIQLLNYLINYRIIGSRLTSLLISWGIKCMGWENFIIIASYLGNGTR